LFPLLSIGNQWSPEWSIVQRICEIANNKVKQAVSGMERDERQAFFDIKAGGVGFSKKTVDQTKRSFINSQIENKVNFS